MPSTLLEPSPSSALPPQPPLSPGTIVCAQPPDCNSFGHLIRSPSNNDSQPPLTQPRTRPPYLRSMTSVPSGYSSRHGKLHKRSDSASVLPSPTSTTYSDHHQKLIPFLRNMSLRDHDGDQGRIDLSRPSYENPNRRRASNVSDVTFKPAAARRITHRRTASLSSPPSSQPTAMRTSSSSQIIQPPIRQISQPYSPPFTFSSHEDETEESADIVTDHVGRSSIERWRSRRTLSSTSGPYVHNHSAASLVKAADVSQSNLSERSISSQGGPEMRAARSRRNTAMSFEAPSSRTSFDRAVSLFSRTTSEPEDPAARAANIRALRRAFEEKEAAKERKLEKMEMKKRDRASTKGSGNTTHRRSEDMMNYSEKMAGTEYSRHNSTPDISLPIQGRQSGGAGEEYRVKTEVSKTKQAKGFWVRFQAWTKTRLLSCY